MSGDVIPDGRPTRPPWMVGLFAVASLVMLVIVGTFLYGLTLPDTWSVSESIVIDAPVARVAERIESPEGWTRWSMWSADNDPTLETKVVKEGEKDLGTLHFAGRALGQGKLVLTKAGPDEKDPDARRIKYALYRQGELFSDGGSFLLVPADGLTRVTWSDSGEIGDTTGRLFRERLIAVVSRDYARCLEQLKALVEREANGAGASSAESLDSTASPTSSSPSPAPSAEETAS